MRRRRTDRDPVAMAALGAAIVLILAAPAAAWRMFDTAATIVPFPNQGVTRVLVCAVPMDGTTAEDDAAAWFEETDVPDADLGEWLLSDGDWPVHCWLGN